MEKILYRCRFTGKRDSLDHCTGEGSLAYTNGDRFEVQTRVFCFPLIILCLALTWHYEHVHISMSGQLQRDDE